MSRFIRDFNLRIQKNTFVFSLLPIFFFVLLPYKSFYRLKSTSPLISQVTVSIEGQSSAEEIEKLIPIKEGDPFSLVEVTKSIKQIYKTGLFSDVRVLKEGEEEVRLTFLLTKNLVTRRIIFLGNEGISSKRLKGALFSLREGTAFSEEKLNKGVEELKDVLTEEGYFNPELVASTERDSKSSSVDVIFEIRSARRFVINKIDFSGEPILSEKELKDRMKSKEGRVYIPSVLEEDLARLKEVYTAMDYQRAEISLEEKRFDEAQRVVFLSIKVNPHQKIEIVVNGAKVPLSLLKPIWEAEVFEEWGLTEGEAKIVSYMRNRGYIFASVHSSIERVNNTMRVVYRVVPGKNYKIEDISFEGLNYFTPPRLKEELKITEKVPFLGWLNGARLFELPSEIEFLYKTKGFPQTRVDLNFAIEGNNVRALFYIQEGPQEKVETISFEGAELFGRDILLKQIGSFEGGPFFYPNIQKDIEKLQNFYLNEGVRGTEINARTERVNGNLFSVIYSVKEGEKVKIEKIIITGNNVTQRSVIRRELKVKEGDYAFYDKIRESKSRLERLGIFSKISIEEIPVSSGIENLVINVREGERNYASLGLGLETKSEPQTFVVWNNPLRLRGTGEIIRHNILGRAAQLSLVGQVSLKEKRGVLSWEQPYFLGLRMPTYLNAWWEAEERTSFSYRRQGLSLTGIKSPSKNMMFLTTLRLASTTLTNLQIEESEVDRQHSPFSLTSISGSFIWDMRDDPFNTEKGAFFSIVLEQAYPLFESESNYIKSFIKYQHFVPLLSRVTFSLTSRLGFGGGKKPIPIHERFFAGGSNSFRGTRFDELGPKDPRSLKPIGGEALLLFNVELKFPLISALKDLSGAIFYDKGNVFDEPEHFTLTALQDSLGFGIRYITPLGPVRFDIGWNLDAPGGQRKALAFITIGNVF